MTSVVMTGGRLERAAHRFVAPAFILWRFWPRSGVEVPAGIVGIFAVDDQEAALPHPRSGVDGSAMDTHNGGQR